MLSKRTVQAAVDEIHRFLELTIAVTDSEGRVLIFPESGPGLPEQNVFSTFADSDRQVAQAGLWILIKINERDRPVLVAAVEAQGRDRRDINGIRCVFSMALRMERERFGREDFYKKLLTGSPLPSQIKRSAYELGIPEKRKRIIYTVRFPADKSPAMTDLLCSRLNERLSDTALVTDRNTVAVVHEPAEEGLDAFEEALLAEIRAAGPAASVGCGKEVSDICDLADSYREALSAIKAGRIFGGRKHILRYSELLFEAFVCQMPVCLCEEFLHFTFGEGFFINMDEETAKTANVFLDNTMNMTQTSKELFFHRNTLNYRLTNIRGESGLDLRDFRDATVFRLGWTIFRYIQDYNISK